MGKYCVYRNQAAAIICPFISSFFFLSNYQTLKIFITSHFSQELWGVGDWHFVHMLMWGLEDWNSVHTWTVGKYRVYRNQAAAAYLSLYFFIFLSLQFSNIKFFVTLFSRTVRPRRLKLGTHMDRGQMYRVYWNQAAAAYSSLYFFIFFLSNFQTLKFFITLLSGTVRPWRLKFGTHMEKWVDVSCI